MSFPYYIIKELHSLFRNFLSKCCKSEYSRPELLERNTLEEGGTLILNLAAFFFSLSTVIGNQFASSGHFDMAVKYFTDAIKYNPAEFR